MVGLFKNIFSRKKPVVSIGEINPKPKVKRKVVNVSEKQLRVTKVNGKTQFYSVRLNEHEHLHLSVLGKKFVKEHPEMVKFISENLNNNFKKLNFENKSLKLKLKKIISKDGLNNEKLLKIDLFLKETKEEKSFFLKVAGKDFLSKNEFLANQAFQKYGINTIKPHFSFTNTSTRKSIIVYDFSNLKTVKELLSENKLTSLELVEINKKISSIYNSKALSTYVHDYNKKNIFDFTDFKNIFVKRNKEGVIELYFTDLAIS
jgi:hypothetical protein